MISEVRSLITLISTYWPLITLIGCDQCLAAADRLTARAPNSCLDDWLGMPRILRAPRPGWRCSTVSRWLICDKWQPYAAAMAAAYAKAVLWEILPSKSPAVGLPSTGKENW